MRRFGQVKQDIVNYLTENYQKENFADSFKKVFKQINEAKEFKEVFNAYTQIEEASFPNDTAMAELFLNEALEDIKRNIYTKGVVFNQNVFSNRLPLSVPNPIYEAIDTMIYGKDLMGRVQAKKTLVDHLRREPSETPKFEPVNEAVLITLLTNQFNETFGDINESERAKLAGYLNLSGEELRKAMYEKRLSAREKLTSLSEEAEKDVKDKIIETLNEVETMETNRLNLYKLDNLLSDLG